MTGLCTVDGCETPASRRGWCRKHYDRWRRGAPVEVDPPSHEDGLGVCECALSYPDPKCCRTCGFPSVHRMAPQIRFWALSKMPRLRHQVVVAPADRGAA